MAWLNILGTHKSNAKACCRANTAKCRSCAAGLDIEEYCENNPTIIGCEGVKFNVYAMIIRYFDYFSI